MWVFKRTCSVPKNKKGDFLSLWFHIPLFHQGSLGASPHNRWMIFVVPSFMAGPLSLQAVCFEKRFIGEQCRESCHEKKAENRQVQRCVLMGEKPIVGGYLFRYFNANAVVKF